MRSGARGWAGGGASVLPPDSGCTERDRRRQVACRATFPAAVRCTSMPPRVLALDLGLSLVALGAAPAPPRAPADTTTFLRPPARSPVTIPGSTLQHGEALGDGQLLMRRLV